MMQFENPIHFDKDSTKAWQNYYTKKSQIGSGIVGYRGDIFQRGGALNGYRGDLYQTGSGFWSSIARFALPVVKYMGPKAANTLISAGADALEGNNFVDSLKKQSKSTVNEIVGDLLGGQANLNGNGFKNKRGRKRKSSKSKTSKKRRGTKTKKNKKAKIDENLFI